MENVSNVDKLESIKSLQSTISKLENALSQMTQKGANTTLVKKRLKAVCIGLAMLENVWNQRTPSLHPGRFSRSSQCYYWFIPIN